MAMVFAPDMAGQSAQPIAMAAGLWLLTGTLTLSGSYATGGDTVDLTKYTPAGPARRVWCLCDVRGFTAEYDLTNKKILLFGVDPAAASIQVAAAQHAAAAYDADLAVAHSMAFLIRA